MFLYCQKLQAKKNPPGMEPGGSVVPQQQHKEVCVVGDSISSCAVNVKRTSRPDAIAHSTTRMRVYRAQTGQAKAHRKSRQAAGFVRQGLYGHKRTAHTIGRYRWPIPCRNLYGKQGTDCICFFRLRY